MVTRERIFGALGPSTPLEWGQLGASFANDDTRGRRRLGDVLPGTRERPDVIIWEEERIFSDTDANDWTVEALLALDGPGWASLLAGQGSTSRDIHHLDDLVSLWLSADDYRRLRRLASDLGRTGDVDGLMASWLSDEDVRRLGYLVVGMGFAEPRYPVCYAVCSAKRAAQAVLERVGGEPGFSDAEIAAMLDSAADAEDDDVALAATGLDDDIALWPA